MGQEIDQINRERKLQQTGVGSELSALEAEWQALVAKNREIEAACVDMEAQIAALRPQEE